jgi:hypothetical protein
MRRSRKPVWAVSSIEGSNPSLSAEVGRFLGASGGIRPCPSRCAKAPQRVNAGQRRPSCVARRSPQRRPPWGRVSRGSRAFRFEGPGFARQDLRPRCTRHVAGESGSDLAHTVRLLELPDQAIELIDSGRLAKGHGKVLLTEPDHDRRRQLAHRAAESGWSVRDLEAEIIRAAESRPARTSPHPDHVAAAELSKTRSPQERSPA